MVQITSFGGEKGKKEINNQKVWSIEDHTYKVRKMAILLSDIVDLDDDWYFIINRLVIHFSLVDYVYYVADAYHYLEDHFYLYDG